MNKIRIRYLGKRLPKIVELPIPLKFKSDKTGEVVCDPVGDFPIEDGERLLAMSEMFVREPGEAVYYGHLCACGCGTGIEIKEHHRWNGVPRYIAGHATRHQMKQNAVPATEAKQEAVSADS